MKTAAEILIDAARPRTLVDAIMGRVEPPRRRPRPPLPGEIEMSAEMARQWEAQAELRMVLSFALGGNAVARAEA